MKYLFKIIVALMLLVVVINHNQIKQYVGFESMNETSVTEINSKTDAIEKVEDNFESTNTEQATIASSETDGAKEFKQTTGDYLVNDSLYRWDPIQLNWVAVKVSEKVLEQPPTPTFISHKSAAYKPIVIDWSLLLNIEYKAKYYKEYEMKMYAPVFPETLKVIDGKEVIIQGFVIPFDETGEIVALSANPFASCFFCGKASPASVISLYLKDKKLYKMDDYRKFRGKLKLNYDDPEEYYYILENSVPLK